MESIIDADGTDENFPKICIDGETLSSELVVSSEKRFKALKELIEASTGFEFKDFVDHHKLEDLRSKIRDKDEKIQELQDEVSEWKEDYKNQSTEFSELRQKHKDLKQDLEEVRSDRDELLEEKDGLQNEVLNLEDKIEELKEDSSVDHEQSSSDSEEASSDASGRTYSCSECDKEFGAPVTANPEHHDCEGSDEEESPEFIDKDAESRREIVREIIREEGPIGVIEVCEEISGESVSSTSKLYKDVSNAISGPNSIRSELEKQKEGKRVKYELSSSSSSSSSTESKKSVTVSDEENTESVSSSEEDQEDNGVEKADDPDKIIGDQGEFASIKEFRDTDLDFKKKYLKEIIGNHQPVTEEGLARKMFDTHRQQALNQVKMSLDIIDDLLEREEVDGRTLIWMDGQRMSLPEGAHRLQSIDPKSNKVFICAHCMSSNAVFDSKTDARSHKKDMGCDAWITSSIPLPQWQNDETVQKIVEKKTGPIKVTP